MSHSNRLTLSSCRETGGHSCYGVNTVFLLLKQSQDEVFPAILLEGLPALLSGSTLVLWRSQSAY